MLAKFFATGRFGLLLALLLCLGLYIFTLAPALLPGDCAEFQFLAAYPGIAHASGYSVYLSLLYLLDHLLPMNTTAWNSNFFSVLCALLFLVIWSKVYFRLAGQKTGAVQNSRSFLLVMMIVVSPLFWFLSLIAEVYTFQLCLFAGIAYALLLWQQEQQARYLFLLAFLCSFGLLFHLITLMILPATGLLMLLYWRQLLQPRHLGLMLLAILCAAGLKLGTFYAFWQLHNPLDHLHGSILANADLWDLQSSGFWQEFWFVYSGGQFHDRMLSFSFAELSLVPYKILYLVGYVGAAFALLGLWRLFKLAQRWFWFSVIFASTVIVLNTSYDFPGIIVYYLPLIMPLSLWAMLGLEWTLSLLLKHYPQLTLAQKPGPVLLLTLLGLGTYISGLYLAQNLEKTSRYPEIRYILQGMGNIPDLAHPDSSSLAAQVADFNKAVHGLLTDAEDKSVIFTEWLHMYALNYAAFEDYKNKDIRAFEFQPLSPKGTFSAQLPAKIRSLMADGYTVYFLFNTTLSAAPQLGEEWSLQELSVDYLLPNTRLYRLMPQG